MPKEGKRLLSSLCFYVYENYRYLYSISTVVNRVFQCFLMR